MAASRRGKCGGVRPGPGVADGEISSISLRSAARWEKEIDFAALRARCARDFGSAATGFADAGQNRYSANADIHGRYAYGSTCPPLIHSRWRSDGQFYWDAGYSGNPPVVRHAAGFRRTYCTCVAHPDSTTAGPILVRDRSRSTRSWRNARERGIAALEGSQRDGASASEGVGIYRLPPGRDRGLAQRSSVSISDADRHPTETGRLTPGRPRAAADGRTEEGFAIEGRARRDRVLDRPSLATRRL